MTDFYFLRHGVTEWNQQKRLQGRTDISLSAAGRALLRQRQLPAHLRNIPWYSSPLQRALQTAECLSLQPEPCEALIEMNWGDWEGQQLPVLRSAPEYADEFRRQENRGLQLQPPGGERPVDVQTRVSTWAAQFSQQPEQRLGCICHKGVIRAIYAAASGWDMQGKPPHKLDFTALQVFSYDQGWHIKQLNLALPQSPPMA